MTTPSRRLRDDLNPLISLTREAPLDECGWGWEHHADNIKSILGGLDRDYAELLQNVETMSNERRK
jgi:hypothetical protein